MYINKIEIDSEVYGRNFLEIRDYTDTIDFFEFERQYVQDYNPFYVSCKLPVENIGLISSLARSGFEFIEFQIREQLNLKKNGYPIYKPYVMELVTDQKDLEEVLTIVATTFEHDRFTIDPLVTKSFSGKRYQEYVKKSFTSNDEFLYKLYNVETKEILGFKTHKILNDNEALMFLGGVANKYKKSPIPVISSYLELNQLVRKGIKKATTHISGSNYGVLNLEVKEFGYKVVNGFVVLRKVYDN